MAAPNKTFYITTPIYYVNDRPHIGHAYTTLACDALARFKRLDGFEVMFLTGTDEHGQKVQKTADGKGVDPQIFTDELSQTFRDLNVFMNYSNTDFIRTTEERHKKACQALWRRLIERGEIYLGTYAGWYSLRDEAFFSESELKTGPNGEKLTPNGAPVEWVEEPSYFFRLSAWGDKLLKFYDDHPDFILPESRRNEVVSFVKMGLQDLSVSRTSFSWGVPVPDRDDRHNDKHIMYVWLDALTNYLTAVGFPDLDAPAYATYWPASLHMIGKDILRFHAIYWPAFLMAGDLPTPHRVFAHGWWTNEGQKISKSLGNVIDPYALVEKYGLDQVRYFLLREIPFGSDGDFSHAAMVNRMNGELANDLGNLAQRVLSMIAKNCNGAVPLAEDLQDEDRLLLQAAYGLLESVRERYDRQAFHEALEAMWSVVRGANAYVDRQAPWALRKSDLGRMSTVLWTLAEVVRSLALLMQPITPTSAGKMLDQLAVPSDARTFVFFGATGALRAGTPLPRPEGVFPRFSEPEDAA